jgi:ATP-dependent Clp protease ATP-binding subunit ClpB
MNIEIYSDRAKQAIAAAQQLALARGHQQFAPDHLLKVLLDERDGPNGAGLTRSLIQQAGGRPDVAVEQIDAALSKRPKVEGGAGQLYMTPDLARVFTLAEDTAKAAGDAFVTTERLLLALARDGGRGAEVVRRDAAKARRRHRRGPSGPHRRQRLGRGGL